MKAATFEFFGLPRRLQVGSLSVYMLRFSVLCLGPSLYTKCIDHQRWGGAFGDVATILGEDGIQNGYQYVMGWTKSKSARIRADEMPHWQQPYWASGY